jgi:hypothetical protein
VKCRRTSPGPITRRQGAYPGADEIEFRSSDVAVVPASGPLSSTGRELPSRLALFRS